MYQVDSTEIMAWGTTSAGNTSWSYPLAISATCPHCSRHYGFSLENRVTEHNLSQGVPVKTLCPGCREPVTFFLVNPGPDQGTAWSGELFMHPSPRVRSKLALTGTSGISDRLAKDYSSAVDCYNGGMWRAAAQEARIVLEGVVKNLTEQGENATLAARLRSLTKSYDLARPILDVADALREGGNLASHFNEDRDIDQETAEQMLELLDAFVEYLLLLPAHVSSLRARLSD
jgi:Domain of unknown function (DUF4145)